MGCKTLCAVNVSCCHDHAHAAFGDEGDAVAFEGFAEQAQGAFVWGGLAGFEIAHRGKPNIRAVGEVALFPVQ